jgi:TonB family protein
MSWMLALACVGGKQGAPPSVGPWETEASQGSSLVHTRHATEVRYGQQLLAELAAALEDQELVSVPVEAGRYVGYASLLVAADGQVRDSSVEQSCGEAALDEFFLASLAANGPYSPPAAELLGLESLSLQGLPFVVQASPTGAEAAAPTLQESAYMAAMRMRVNEHWAANLEQLPAGLLFESRYSTVVAVTLSADGQVVSIELVQGCGLDELDEAVLGAWEHADPFPVPPQELIGDAPTLVLSDATFTVNVWDSLPGILKDGQGFPSPVEPLLDGPRVGETVFWVKSL